MINRVYNAEPTLSRFHRSNAFYRAIRGPVRSGKSVGVCMEIMRRAQMQRKGADGIRHSRWLVARRTYRELMDTTIKTWLQWFDEDHFGAFQKGNMIHHIQQGDIDLEVMFRALERPEDAEKLLSLELTGAWLNEARQFPKGIVDTLSDRVGQFPSKSEGGCSYRGVMLDTNSPDEDHWWYKLSEESDLKQWEFFNQPGALLEVDGKFKMNPKAENLSNLNEGPNYYIDRADGKSKDYVRVYYCNQYGFVSSGRPVIQGYVDAVHCPGDILKPVKNVNIIVGIDFGLTPAALFAQQQVNGQWIWFDELVTENCGAKQFGDQLLRHINKEYQGFKFEFFGDPAGQQQAQTDKTTPFQVLNQCGIPAVPAPTNDFMIRCEGTSQPLCRLIDGKPGLIISPKCKMARKGLAGGYCLKRIQVAGAERFKDEPDKNKYSHVVEAGGYAMIGAGEGFSIVGVVDQDTEDLEFKSQGEWGTEWSAQSDGSWMGT